MEFLAEIPVIGVVLQTVLAFLIVLSIVVFIHEYGHYIVGRWCGIRAETFSIGFGKEIFGWTDKRGTRWRISLLPLGGYVKFLGDNDPASAGKTDEKLSAEENAASFHGAALWKRTLTVLAGPMANFLLSILVFAGLAMWQGQPSQEPVIHELTGAAHPELGLELGDRVLAVDDVPVEKYHEVIIELRKHEAETFVVTEEALVPVEIERQGQPMTVDVFFHRPGQIVEAPPGGRAVANGLRSGDRFIFFSGERVQTLRDLQFMIAEYPKETPVTVVLGRGHWFHVATFTPDVLERRHPLSYGRRWIPLAMPLPTLGVTLDTSGGIRTEQIEVGPLLALEAGANRTWLIISGTTRFLADLVTLQADLNQLGGPIRIAEVSGHAAITGLMTLLLLIGTISTSIGFLNLLPIPVLDGGHLVFYAAEAVRGKPLGERWLSAASIVGLTLVLCLMAFATYNDIARF